LPANPGTTSELVNSFSHSLSAFFQDSTIWQKNLSSLSFKEVTMSANNGSADLGRIVQEIMFGDQYLDLIDRVYSEIDGFVRFRANTVKTVCASIPNPPFLLATRGGDDVIFHLKKPLWREI
jgi:hypothetical protein